MLKRLPAFSYPGAGPPLEIAVIVTDIVLAVRMPYALALSWEGSPEVREALEARLREMGYVAYTPPGETAPGREGLLIGAFKSRREAEAASGRLSEKGLRPVVVKR